MKKKVLSAFIAFGAATGLVAEGAPVIVVAASRAAIETVPLSTPSASGRDGTPGSPSKKVSTLTPVSSATADLAKILSKFEKEVSSSAEALAGMRRERLKLDADVARLKEESAALRKKNEEGSNVLIEARLKVVLGELRAKLGTQSIFESRWEEKRREFVEKALSLLSLYNDRIEMEIASSEAFLNPAGSQERLDSLVDTARKRMRLQEYLELYRGSMSTRVPDTAAWSPASLPPSKDAESLQLTIRLIKDRRRDVESRIERSALLEDEIHKEIRLRERMSEFMDDIERMRENAAFPLHGSKRRDLDWFRGKDQIGRLKEKLLQVRHQREKDQITLIKLDAYLEQMSYQLKVLKGKGGITP